ncbi:hypothetical protein D3C79_1050540 [compost metagenome]
MLFRGRHSQVSHKLSAFDSRASTWLAVAGFSDRLPCRLRMSDRFRSLTFFLPSWGRIWFRQLASSSRVLVAFLNGLACSFM